MRSSAFEYLSPPGSSRRLAERERVRLGAGLEERDLQRSVADGIALAHQLVHAVIAQYATAVLLDVRAGSPRPGHRVARIRSPGLAGAHPVRGNGPPSWEISSLPPGDNRRGVGDRRHGPATERRLIGCAHARLSLVGTSVGDSRPYARSR